jgi:anti-anti-sigma factor
LTEQASIVAVGGDVDLDTASMLEATLLSALASGVRDLIVELSEVTFLDSSGLSALVKVWHAASEQGGTIRLTGASRNARKVLSITGLDQILPMDDSVRTALASCGIRASSAERPASFLATTPATRSRSVA